MHARVHRREGAVPVTLFAHYSEARMKICESARREGGTAGGELKKRLIKESKRIRRHVIMTMQKV